MKDLHIDAVQGVYLSPKVHFEFESGVCEIEGESYLENTTEFYAPVFEWLEVYFSRKKDIIFNFKLTYFNTSSSKSILDMMCLLKDFEERKNGLVLVNWYYPHEDLDIMADAEDLMYEAQIKMNLIPYYY